MKNKLVVIFVCIVMLIVVFPIIKADDNGTIMTTPIKLSSGEWNGLFFGSVTNWTVFPNPMGTCFNAVNVWLISYSPLQIVHFTNNEALAYAGNGIEFNGHAIGFGFIRLDNSSNI